VNIDGININYIQYGNKNGKDIVLLHGWGQNIEMMDPIGKRLEDDFYITNIDLPGYGKSEEPKRVYTIYDYYETIKKLLNKLKINNPILIGHSFGGRIAIVYAAKEKVDKLVLLAAPYKKSNKSDTLKVRILKFLKKVPLLNKLAPYMKTKIGSKDYRSATPIMRDILVKTINEDLEQYLKEIKAPTLLIWGTNDKEASIEDAKYAESIMENAGLVVYEGCSHYAYLERLNQTISVLKSFLKEDE